MTRTGCRTSTTPVPPEDGAQQTTDEGQRHDGGDPGAPAAAPAAARFFNERLGSGQRRILGRRARPVGGGQGHGATLTITMLDVKVERGAVELLHDQVAAELRRALADGEAKPGDRLPPAKDLAAVLGVNVNTVLRALRQLRDEGLLEFRRGRGVTVTGTPERSAVLRQARELVALARRCGYRKEELVGIIEGLAQ